MALIYAGANREQIEDIITSEGFKKYKEEFDKMLNIHCVGYKVATDDVAIGEGGYPEQFTNARVTFKENYSDIDKMVFYTETIKETINTKFLKLSVNELVFNRVIDIFVKATLIHELIHILQFQQGRLDKDIMMEEKKLPYKDRFLEKEANERARTIISSYGEFEAKIAEYIYSNDSVDNNSLTSIIEISSK